MLGPNEVVIHEGNWRQYARDVTVGGDKKARGLIPRNYATHPQGCYAAAPSLSTDFPLIPQSDWSGILKEKAAAKSLTSDVRNRGNHGKPIPSRDQNGRGYCWMHSGTGALILLRARQNEPYADLSAYGPACVIKNFQDEGGWGAQGVDFLRDRGCPTSKTWPQQSMSRSNDNATTWAEAANYKVTDGFWDLATPEYDRKLTFQQEATLLLRNVPVVTDYNWWGHSVVTIDLVDGTAAMNVLRAESGKLMTLQELERVFDMSNEVTGGFGVRIWNSWGDSWSENGTGVLTGNKAISDSAVAPQVALSSAA